MVVVAVLVLVSIVVLVVVLVVVVEVIAGVAKVMSMEFGPRCPGLSVGG